MTVLKALAIIGGFIIAGFIMVATYSALTVASYWDDIEENEHEQEEDDNG